jgi:hypothetical protein
MWAYPNRAFVATYSNVGQFVGHRPVLCKFLCSRRLAPADPRKSIEVISANGFLHF